MANTAVAIGINDYAGAHLNLTGAVSDALRFAEWVVQEGGVQPANLHLLLSPAGALPPSLGTPATLDVPSRSVINRTIDLFLNQRAGAGFDRLYFYYAGHGLSTAGSLHGSAEPGILPRDVADVRLDGHLILPLSEVFDRFSQVEPGEQFFFFDACRDFPNNIVHGIGTMGIAGALSLPAGRPSQQFVLFATSPGAQAFNPVYTGAGIYTDELLNGLRGAGSGKRYHAGANEYHVRFSTLTDFVSRTVEDRVNKIGGQWTRYVQVPVAKSSFRRDPVLAKIPAAAVQDVDVEITFQPASTPSVVAHAERDGQVVRSVGPPIASPAKIALPPREYSLRVEASGYEAQPDSETCDLYEPLQLPVQFRPLQGPRAPISASPPPPPSGPGSLEVKADDPNTPIEILDNNGTVLASGFYRLSLANLPPGFYRIRHVDAAGSRRERVEEVRPGDRKFAQVATRTQLAGRSAELLDRAGVPVRDGGAVIAMSEYFGERTSVDLANVLSMAAFATVARYLSEFHKLRGLDLIRDAKGLSAGESGLGVIMASEAEGIDWDGVRVGLYRFQPPLFEPLAASYLSRGEKLPIASESFRPCKAGSYLAVIGHPAFDLQSFVVTVMENRVTVLVGVIRENGRFDVRQFMPTFMDDVWAQDRWHPEQLPLLEVAQRFYANSGEVPPFRELDDVFKGAWLDPLFTALAGYVKLESGGLERVDLAGMVDRFSGLPDAWIIRGALRGSLLDFRRALKIGLPAFAAGLGILVRAMPEIEKTGDAAAYQMCRLARDFAAALPPGSIWSAPAGPTDWPEGRLR